MAGYYIKSYVVVSDVVHHTFTGIQSEIKGPFYITGTQPGDIAEIVHFLPYAQDGTNIYNLVSPKHWRYTLNPPQWKTGYRSFLTRGHTEVIKSDPNFVSSINQKFLFWNNNSSNCVNYGKFPIVAGYGDIKAQYWSVYGNVVIQNYFLSANGANPEGDSIGFKDPWLIDYYESPYGLRNQGMDAPFKNRPSPFNPDYTTSYDGDVYQGVFLNKNPQFQQGKPIYFVEAMQEQVISFNNEDILWYFQGWNGTDVQFEHAEQTRTSVVFKQDGAVARAVYKGHLVSSTNRALRNNGQMKMIYSGNNYYLVYEDNNRIYFTYSTDNGQTWSKEFLVSYDVGENRYPSISMNDNGDILIVWQYYYGTPQILARYRHVNGNWDDVNYITYFFTSENMETTPVVFYSNSYSFHIIYRNTLEGYEGLWVVPYNSSQAVKIPGTGASSCHPTATSDFAYKDYVAWEDHGRIFSCQFDYYDGEYSFEEPEEVSDLYGYVNNAWPCITVDAYRNVNLMWQAHHTALELQVLVHARRLGSAPNDWLYFTFVGKDENYALPSISGYPNASTSELDAAWINVQKGWIERSHFDGEEWGKFYSTDYGSDPNLGLNLSSYYDNHFVYRRDDDAPMRLRLYHDIHNKENALSYQVRRRGVVSLGGNMVALELGDVQVNQQPISWYGISDSLYALHHGSWSDLFRTEVFRLPENAQLSFYRDLSVSLKKGFSNSGKGLVKLQVEVVDAENGSVLHVPYQVNVGSHMLWHNAQYQASNLTVPGNRQVYLRVRVKPLVLFKIREAVGDVYVIHSSGKEILTNNSINNDHLNNLPQNYALYPNYPNPFNPSTTIEFDVPEQSMVKLVVYDVAGRRIRTLANGSYAAGHHQVVWDGRDERGVPVASGVYIYRLTAGSHHFTRKMMLMK